MASSRRCRQGEAREVGKGECTRACGVCTCVYVRPRVSWVRARLYILLCVSRDVTGGFGDTHGGSVSMFHLQAVTGSRNERVK